MAKDVAEIKKKINEKSEEVKDALESKKQEMISEMEEKKQDMEEKFDEKLNELQGIINELDVSPCLPNAVSVLNSEDVSITSEIVKETIESAEDENLPIPPFIPGAQENISTTDAERVEEISKTVSEYVKASE